METTGTNSYFERMWDEYEGNDDVGPHDLLAILDGGDICEALLSLGLLHRYLSEVEDDLVTKAQVECCPWPEIAMRLGRTTSEVVAQHDDPQFPSDEDDRQSESDR